MKKKVLFIPGLSYLSNPIFCSICNTNNGFFQTIYLNPNFPFSKKDIIDNYQSKEIRKSFDQFIEINHSDFDYFKQNIHNSNFINKIKNLPVFIKKLKNYKVLLHDELKRIQPAIIVVDTDLSTVSLILNKWAIKNSVPVIIMQSAFVNLTKSSFYKKLKNGMFYLLINKIYNIPFVGRQMYYGNEFESNYIFIWGNYFKKIIRNKRVTKQIRIVGNPLFDDIDYNLNEKMYNKSAILKKSDNRPIISIFTQILSGLTSNNEVKEIENSYYKIINNNPQWFFILKVHPRESIDKYKSIFSKINGNNYLITQSIDNKEIFYFSDVQISVFSYSSFDAVLHNTPIILFRIDKINATDSFNNEIELRANNLSELENCIKKTLSKDYQKEFHLKRKKFLKSRINLKDNKSVGRVMTEIKNILRNT